MASRTVSRRAAQSPSTKPKKRERARTVARSASVCAAIRQEEVPPVQAPEQLPTRAVLKKRLDDRYVAVLQADSALRLARQELYAILNAYIDEGGETLDERMTDLAWTLGLVMSHLQQTAGELEPVVMLTPPTDIHGRPLEPVE